jgi:hypothetical protein
MTAGRDQVPAGIRHHDLVVPEVIDLVALIALAQSPRGLGLHRHRVAPS